VANTRQDIRKVSWKNSKQWKGPGAVKWKRISGWTEKVHSQSWAGNGRFRWIGACQRRWRGDADETWLNPRRCGSA